MKKLSYAIDEDVEEYNAILKKSASTLGGCFVAPYENFCQELLLPDGHHLSRAGAQKVFLEVDRVLQALTKDL